MSVKTTVSDMSNFDVVIVKVNKMEPECRISHIVADAAPLNIRSDFIETKKFSPKKLSAFKRFFRWKSDAEPGTPTSDAPPSPTERTSFKSDTDPTASNSTSSFNFYGMGDTSRNVLGPQGKLDQMTVQSPESYSPRRISSFEEFYSNSDVKQSEIHDKSHEETIDELFTAIAPESSTTESFTDTSSTTTALEVVEVLGYEIVGYKGTKSSSASLEVCKTSDAFDDLQAVAGIPVQAETSAHEFIHTPQSTKSVNCRLHTSLHIKDENNSSQMEEIAEHSPASHNTIALTMPTIVLEQYIVAPIYSEIQSVDNVKDGDTLADMLSPGRDDEMKSELSPVVKADLITGYQTKLITSKLMKETSDCQAQCNADQSESMVEVKVAYGGIYGGSIANDVVDSPIVSKSCDIKKPALELQGHQEAVCNKSSDCTVTLMAERFGRGMNKNLTANYKPSKDSPTYRVPTIIECQPVSNNIKTKSSEIKALLYGTKDTAHEILWKVDRHASSSCGKPPSPINRVLLEDKAIIDQMSNKVTIGVLLADGEARGKLRKTQAFLTHGIASFDENSEGESDENLETEHSVKKLPRKTSENEDDYVDEETDQEKQSEVTMMSLKSARFAKRLDYLKSVSKLNHNRGITNAGDNANANEVYYSKDECCDVEGIKYFSPIPSSDRLREAPESKLNLTTEIISGMNTAASDTLISPIYKTDDEVIDSPEIKEVKESNGLLSPTACPQAIAEMLPLSKKSGESRAPSLLARLFGPQILICCASDVHSGK
jgi:hypothetical protein